MFDFLVKQCSQPVSHLCGDVSLLPKPNSENSNETFVTHDHSTNIQSLPSGVDLESVTTTPSVQKRRARVPDEFKLLSQPVWARDESIIPNTETKPEFLPEINRTFSDTDEDLESPEGLFTSATRLLHDHLFLQAENRFAEVTLPTKSLQHVLLFHFVVCIFKIKL